VSNNNGAYQVTVNNANGQALSKYPITIAGNYLGVSSKTDSFTSMSIPTSSFISSVNNLTVQFNDTSTGLLPSWSWNFGDGSTSTLQNPTHTYNSPGTYQVSLTVSNPVGSNTSTQNTVIKYNAQVAQQGSATTGILNDWSVIVSLVIIIVFIGFFYIAMEMMGGRMTFKQATPFVTTASIMILVIAFVSYILYILLSAGA
jgi:PKD repeat protein